MTDEDQSTNQNAEKRSENRNYTRLRSTLGKHTLGIRTSKYSCFRGVKITHLINCRCLQKDQREEEPLIYCPTTAVQPSVHAQPWLIRETRTLFSTEKVNMGQFSMPKKTAVTCVECASFPHLIIIYGAFYSTESQD